MDASDYIVTSASKRSVVRSPGSVRETSRIEDDEKSWLEKSNFDLKMKVYYLEENLKKMMDSGAESASDELKNEIASLRLQLEERNIEVEQRNALLLKAKAAIEALKSEIGKLRDEKSTENSRQEEYEFKLRQVQRQSEDAESKYRAQIDRLESQISNLQQSLSLKENLCTSADEKTVCIGNEASSYSDAMSVICLSSARL
jgi:chromosome segregation ATPase